MSDHEQTFKITNTPNFYY